MRYRNLVELHRLRAERLGPLPALRYRKNGLYYDVSWDKYRDDALACAAALIGAGIKPADRVGLLSENRVEWLVADLGIMTAAAVSVPLHAPLSASQCQFQLSDAGVSWLLVSTEAQLEKTRAICQQLTGLRGIVVFDRNARKGDVLSWQGFLQRGRRALPALRSELARREAALEPSTLATIMYTSGTTGNAKGVMLTHGNLLSNACAMLSVAAMAPDSVVMNWLPFSHIYARTVDHYKSMVAGVLMCLAQSAETVMDDIKETSPTHMSSVPRLYEKVLAAVASPNSEETGRRLRCLFGPRMDWLGAGGAPLPVPVAEAYRSAGLDILQGYGLTECAPVITFNRKTNNKIGTVGQAIPGVEVSIGPDGEVLTRGPHVMPGYWNNPQATAEALRDGWLHTGDLGTLDDEGFLTITGRKKELLVLSNGKKVVPSYIEGLLIADPYIDQAVVCGEGRNYLTALVVPHWDNVRQALREKNAALVDASAESLAQNEAVRAFLQRRIDTLLESVSGWERVKRFAILPRPFSVAAEELTVSLKLRRSVVLEKYQAVVAEMYGE